MSRRVPIGLLLLAGLLALPSAVAAAAPSLTATVIPGREIDLAGAGFPASASVTLAITRNDAPDGSMTVTSDATGAFTATIDAGPGRGGHYVIVATAGTSTASADVVAVETAGGLAGGTSATPPATDLAPASPPGGLPSGLLLPTMLTLALAGLLGGWWTRDRVSRRQGSTGRR